jgi:hypothetical protein
VSTVIGGCEQSTPALCELCDDRFERMDAGALEVLDTDIGLPDVERRRIPHDLTARRRHTRSSHRGRGFPGDFSLKQSNGDMVRFNSTAPCNGLHRTRRHPSWYVGLGCQPAQGSWS